MTHQGPRGDCRCSGSGGEEDTHLHELPDPAACAVRAHQQLIVHGGGGGGGRARCAAGAGAASALGEGTRGVARAGEGGLPAAGPGGGSSSVAREGGTLVVALGDGARRAARAGVRVACLWWGRGEEHRNTRWLACDGLRLGLGGRTGAPSDSAWGPRQCAVQKS